MELYNLYGIFIVNVTYRNITLLAVVTGLIEPLHYQSIILLIIKLQTPAQCHSRQFNIANAVDSYAKKNTAKSPFSNVKSPSLLKLHAFADSHEIHLPFEENTKKKHLIVYVFSCSPNISDRFCWICTGNIKYQ